MVRAPDLKSGGHGFKSCSDHLAGVVSRWTIVHRSFVKSCVAAQNVRLFGKKSKWENKVELIWPTKKSVASKDKRKISGVSVTKEDVGHCA